MKRVYKTLFLIMALLLLCSCSVQEHSQVMPEQTVAGEQKQIDNIEQDSAALIQAQAPDSLTDKSQLPSGSQPVGALQASAEQSDSPQQLVCSLTVRCDNILNNMDDLAENKHSLVPEDGVIYPVTSLAFTEGETVFDVLLRAMKEAEIHFEFVHTPAYNSTYIEGINNLYEFDCGELSGWEYCVNGQYLAYGCSLYELQDGDVIEWHYTCDLGRDLNNFFKE